MLAEGPKNFSDTVLTTPYIGYLDNKHGGWQMGKFMADSPKLNTNFEVAIMDLPEKDNNFPHYHLKTTEVTICMEGELTIIFFGKRLKIERKIRKGEFIVVPPGIVIQNPENAPGTKVVVFKNFSDPEDKYFLEKDLSNYSELKSGFKK